MTAIIGERFDRLLTLAQTLGVWEHPELGRMTAMRWGLGQLYVEGLLGSAFVSESVWLAHFDGLDFGADGWRRGHWVHTIRQDLRGAVDSDGA